MITMKNITFDPTIQFNNLTSPIVLVGLMGAGKTTVGMRLAKLISKTFADSDQCIEQETRHTVAEIFEKYGEPHFRMLERNTIKRLIEMETGIIATGGGAFIDPESRKLIKEHTISIWLHSNTDVTMERVSRNNARPLLRSPDPKAIIEKLMTERYPVYSEADIEIATDNGDRDEILELIITKLNEFIMDGK